MLKEEETHDSSSLLHRRRFKQPSHSARNRLWAAFGAVKNARGERRASVALGAAAGGAPARGGRAQERARDEEVDQQPRGREHHRDKGLRRDREAADAARLGVGGDAPPEEEVDRGCGGGWCVGGVRERREERGFKM